MRNVPTCNTASVWYPWNLIYLRYFELHCIAYLLVKLSFFLANILFVLFSCSAGEQSYQYVYVSIQQSAPTGNEHNGERRQILNMYHACMYDDDDDDDESICTACHK